jgi:GSH-dependent disulfide-bond oxidoreductase
MVADAYVVPKVWTFDKPNGGVFSNINRPTAGATHHQDLHRGRHPIQLYSQGTWNGIKITILLEELLLLGLKDAEYDAWLIRISRSEQFGSGFVDLNPNSKIPALIDYGGSQPVRIFESGAILLYLAEKFEKFIPLDMPGRMECLSWLFWQMGSAPYLGGGFAHFYRYAPVKLEYPIDRYAMEAKRQLDVLDRRLADRQFMCGGEYTIADVAIFCWYGTLVLGWTNDVREFLSTHEYKNVVRWAEDIAARPATQRGRLVNRIQKDWPGSLDERHDAGNFSQ